jgi:hypothetical protein
VPRTSAVNFCNWVGDDILFLLSVGGRFSRPR